MPLRSAKSADHVPGLYAAIDPPTAEVVEAVRLLVAARVPKAEVVETLLMLGLVES
jgi:hypothetical protein